MMMMSEKALPGRLLALDVGEKRIGVAMSDELGWTAQPLMVIERKNIEWDLAILKKTIEAHQIKKIIVGLPMSLSGKMTEQTKKVLRFMEACKKAWSVPMETWDEALTTQQAEDVLIEANVSRKKRKKVVDKLAAVFILRSYLEAQR